MVVPYLLVRVIYCTDGYKRLYFARNKLIGLSKQDHSLQNKMFICIYYFVSLLGHYATMMLCLVILCSLQSPNSNVAII